jgi:hypothetical protein
METVMVGTTFPVTGIMPSVTEVPEGQEVPVTVEILDVVHVVPEAV